MKLLKNPILWIVVVLIIIGVIGYKVMQKTAEEQEAIRPKQKELLFTLQQYNLYGLAFIPPSTLWAAGSDGMLLHSTDEGDTWTEQKIGTPEDVFSSICFPDSRNGWIVGKMGKILHTTDGGKNWSCVKKGENIYYTKVFFLDPQYGWIVGERGTLLLTTDGGKNWETIDTGKFMITFNDVRFIDRNKGWIVGERDMFTGQGVIMVSTDGGRTWQDQESGVDKSLMSVYPVNADKVWVGGLGGTILLTTDGGSTWIKKKLKYQEKVIDNHVYKVLEQKSGLTGTRNAIYALCRGGQHFSTDTGNSWRALMLTPEIDDLLRRGWLHDIAFHPHNEHMGWAVGKWGIVLKTVDADKWTRMH